MDGSIGLAAPITEAVRRSASEGVGATSTSLPRRLRRWLRFTPARLAVRGNMAIRERKSYSSMRLKRNRQTTGASGRDAAHGDLRQRAAGVCVVVGCTEPSVPGEGRCRGHGPAPWAGSEETGRQLVPPPAVYRRLRRDVRRRARHYCEACGSRVLPASSSRHSE